VRAIAIAELLVRLRWQERQQHAHGVYLTALARMLPRGCRLAETWADGSELHLVINQPPAPTERHHDDPAGSSGKAAIHQGLPRQRAGRLR
jgi:hypothetical protein